MHSSKQMLALVSCDQGKPLRTATPDHPQKTVPGPDDVAYWENGPCHKAKKGHYVVFTRNGSCNKDDHAIANFESALWMDSVVPSPQIFDSHCSNKCRSRKKICVRTKSHTTKVCTRWKLSNCCDDSHCVHLHTASALLLPLCRSRQQT